MRQVVERELAASLSNSAHPNHGHPSDGHAYDAQPYNDPSGEPYRVIRRGTLREILDEEFRRYYRFEIVSDLFHDLKGLFRRVVVRQSNEESLAFPTGASGAERQ